MKPCSIDHFNIQASKGDQPILPTIFDHIVKKLEGMDWRTLRLVFKQWKGKYYLTGVVHDEWTI